MINVDELFNLMADQGFQDASTGNLFFPAYIYTYAAEEEYKMREQILLLTEKLQRPNHYLDSLVLNIYHELIAFLKAESFGRKSIFESVLEKEQEDPERAYLWVRNKLQSEKFIKYFSQKVKAHFEGGNEKKAYLILYGFGSSFPYLRASELLKKTEHLIKDFKLIVFFPGTYKEARYRLFGVLDDDNMYRANYLNRQLGEIKE